MLPLEGILSMTPLYCTQSQMPAQPRQTRILRLRQFLFAPIFAALCLPAACQKYHALPLTDAAEQQALQPPPADVLRVQASQIHHPILKPVQLHPELGLTPDEAAVVAVIVNPSLRAIRDHRASAAAATLQAGILPNPQLTYNADFVTGGLTDGTVTAYGAGINFDFNSLIAHDTKVRGAQASAASVDLDVAWQEWQIAEAAKTAVYDLIALEAQLDVAREMNENLQQNLGLVRRAVASNLKTSLDLAAAESAAGDAHVALLQIQRDVEHQRLQLNRALGFPPDTQIKLRENLVLPARFDPIAEADLLPNLSHRRLDLLALRCGYESQDQTLRVAILNQFPKLNMGPTRNVDNTDVQSLGLTFAADIPIFDRNQGVIAAEKATRQQLFDEYFSRLADARADIASANADLAALSTQIADTESALPALSRLVDTYKQAVDHGNADILSYYTAVNSLQQKKLQDLKLKQQLADTRIALEIASGRYFPESPETQPTTREATAQQTSNPNIASLILSPSTLGEGKGEGSSASNPMTPLATATIPR
jgi:outer membrane protein, heavy metal efflux system